MKTFSAVAASMALAGGAGAAVVRVNESSVGSLSYELTPGNLTESAFGAVAPDLTNAALSAIHARLAADSIDTDSIVTVLAAQTDDGLALIHLIDGGLGAPGAFDARIDFVGHAHDADASGISPWLNDAGGELFQAININPIASTTDILSTFQWDSRGTGDGAAFSRLTPGDNGSSIFVPLDGPGLTGVARGFQYLSFEDDAWIVKFSGQFNPGPSSTSFDWFVVPTPGVGGLVLGGLALAGRRHR